MKITHLGFNPEYSEIAPTYEEISELQGDTLIEFGSPTCGHCLAARSAIEESFTQYVKLPHIKQTDGKGKPLGRAFKVKLWPTLILIRDGKEVDRIVRPLSVEDVSKLLLQSK